MPRRIKKARITHISLVPRGANAMPVLYKDDGAVQFDLLTKAADSFDDDGELLAVVYAPEVRDSQGDIASAEVIKEMAYEYSRSGQQIDIRHDGKSLEKSKAFVAENFIVQKGDPRFQNFTNYEGEPVDVTGAWATVIKVEDEDLRTKYRNGEWNGVSMGGTGEVEVEKQGDSNFLQRLIDRLSPGMEPYTLGDTEMTPEQLEAALAKSNESLATTLTTSITEAITKAIKPGDEPAVKTDDEVQPNTPGKPIFKGDPMKIEDVKAHQLALKKWELGKDVDWDNAESIAKYQERLTEFEAAQAEDDESVEKEEFQTDRERELAAENARLRKASNQTTSTNDQPSGTIYVAGMSKQDNSLFAAGAKAAQAANKQYAN